MSADKVKRQQNKLLSVELCGLCRFNRKQTEVDSGYILSFYNNSKQPYITTFFTVCER